MIAGPMLVNQSDSFRSRGCQSLAKVLVGIERMEITSADQLSL